MRVLCELVKVLLHTRVNEPRTEVLLERFALEQRLELLEHRQRHVDGVYALEALVDEPLQRRLQLAHAHVELDEIAVEPVGMVVQQVACGR